MVGVVSLWIIRPYHKELIRNTILQIKEFVPDVVYIDFHNSFKSLDIIDIVNKIDIVKFDISKYYNWFPLINAIDSFLKEYDFDTIFVLNSCTGRNDRYGVHKVLRYENEYKGTKYGGPRDIFYKYNMKAVYNRIVFMDRLAENGINVIHFGVLPNEIVWGDYMNFKSYRRYSFLKEDFKYAPMYERHLLLERDTFLNGAVRNHKFVFYGTTLNENRDFLVSMQRRFQIAGLKFFAYNPFEEKKSPSCSQNVYYRKLATTQYTYIVKSASDGFFSMSRFLEAVVLGCVPLIDSMVNISMLRETFPDIFEIVMDSGLVVTENHVTRRINHYDRDKQVLEDIMETKSFKKITSYESVKKFFDKLMEAVN
jgi:hypothetical protein